MSATTARPRQREKRGVSAPGRRLFTADEYQQMGKAGILGEDERVELIEGEILLMTPIGSRHAACVNLLTERLVIALAGRAIVSPQNSFRLSLRSEPQPDLCLLRPRADWYAAALPRPGDILLVIEVSDTTLRYDTDTKLPLYAREAVPEVWIVDLRHRRVRTYRDPSESGYRQTEILDSANELSLAAFPDLRIPVSDLIG